MVLAGACLGSALLGGCGSGAGRGSSERARDTVAVVVLDAAGRRQAVVRADGTVLSAAADGAGGWFVSGEFRRIGGVRRRGLAHLDARGMVDRSWRATIDRPEVNSTDLAVGHGRVYLVGLFGRVDGRRRVGAAAVSARSGALDRHWRPRHVVGGPVALGAGRVYATRGSGAVALDPVSGRRLKRFRVRVGPTNQEGAGVYALAAAAGRVFLGGVFARVNGVRRVGVARVRARTGRTVRGWRPPRLRDTGACHCNRAAFDLVATRRRLFVVGSFNHVGRVRTPGGLAAFDARSGHMTRFRAARIGRGVTLYDSATLLGNRLFTEGTFGPGHAHHFAVLDARTGRRLRSWHPGRRDANPIALSASGRRVLVGGSRLGG